MNASRLAVYSTVAVIFAVTVASGPLVGAIDVTDRGYDSSGLGQGNVTVRAVEAPTTGQLDSEFGAEEFYLKIPDATIRVENVTGKPIVSYRISIPGLGHTQAATHFLGESDAGAIQLSLAQQSFQPDAVTEDEYDGELSVLVRRNDQKRTVYSDSITVEVNR